MRSFSRKSFLFAGLALTGIAAFFGRTKPSAKAKQPVKFLAQDGTLVEIDPKYLPVKSRNATKVDIQNWIQKK